MDDSEFAAGAPRWLGAAETPGLAPPVTALDAYLASVERRALRIAEIVTRSREDALDVVQDAMMSLARRYHARDAAEWPPLFHRILENRLRDWQRRSAVRRRLFGWDTARGADDEPGEDAIARAPDRSASVESRMAQGEAMRRLETALRALPRRQRQAFVLRIWEGFSVACTARAMGCSDGSVKTHLSRALGTLRERLDDVWP